MNPCGCVLSFPGLPRGEGSRWAAPQRGDALPRSRSAEAALLSAIQSGTWLFHGSVTACQHRVALQSHALKVLPLLCHVSLAFRLSERFCYSPSLRLRGWSLAGPRHGPCPVPLPEEETWLAVGAMPCPLPGPTGHLPSPRPCGAGRHHRGTGSLAASEVLTRSPWAPFSLGGSPNARSHWRGCPAAALCPTCWGVPFSFSLSPFPLHRASTRGAF